MAEQQTLLAIKVNGMIYRPGHMAPKPMDPKDRSHKLGEDGMVAKIYWLGNYAVIVFEDGQRFELVNMPAIFMFGDAEPNNETAAGDVPAEA